MGEFELIKRYFKRPPQRAQVGVGDDCAIWMPTPGQVLAISSDMLVEGRHFLSTVDAAALGRALFELALEVPGGSLADVGEDAVVALADAADAHGLARIDAGMLDEATLTIDALGDAIDAELAAVETTAGRARLADERLRRGCAARRTYPIAPIIPGTDACP